MRRSLGRSAEFPAIMDLTLWGLSPSLRSSYMSHPLANKVQQTPTVQINLNDDRLSRLKSELLAIDLWDTDYYRLERPCPSDEEAYQSRQLRRKEILQEILSTVSPDSRTFRLRFV